MNTLKTLSTRRQPTAQAVAFLFALAAAQAALAADQDQTPQTLDKVVVTAQKREQALIDVPASVTAVNAERISKSGMSKLEDYVAQVPGMSITSNGASMQVTLRGISTGAAQSAPTTALYIDDAPVGSVNAYTTGAALVPDIDPAELRRIEVLKGPQGTLYGAGAMGGLLRFVTADPDPTRASGSLTLGYNSVAHGGNGQLVRGSANLPLGENMALRFSAYSRTEPGYVDNIDALSPKQDANELRTKGGRLAFGWQLNPDWKLKAMLLTQRLEADGGNATDVNGLTLVPTTGKYQIDNRVPVFAERSLDLGNITIKGLVGDINLVSTTTLQTIDGRATGDASLSYGTLLAVLAGQPGLNVQLDQRTHTRRLAQELRAQTTALDGKLDYEAGIYFTKEDNSNSIPAIPTFNSRTGAVQPVVIPGTAVPFPDGLAKARIDTSYREVSVFANATYALTDKFDVQAGIRWGQDHQHYDQLYTGLLFTPPVALTQDSKNSRSTWLLTGRYKPSATDSIYARIATGYRAGGPSAATPITGASPIVGPDSLTSAEIGWKTVFAGGKASFEAALFNTNWKDIQIQTSKSGSNFFVNGGAAVSRGGEATLAVYPVDGLSLRATVGYTDAHLTEDTSTAMVNATTPLGKRGDRLPFVPKVSASLAGDYRFAVGGAWTASVGAALARIGERRSDYSGKQNISLPGYTTLNLNAAVENANWRFATYVKNATDADGIIAFGDRGLAPFTPTAPYSAGIIQPRTVGVEASYRF
jgi:outer membrane receptor protein involved in Fe transport